MPPASHSKLSSTAMTQGTGWMFVGPSHALVFSSDSTALASFPQNLSALKGQHCTQDSTVSGKRALKHIGIFMQLVSPQVSTLVFRAHFSISLSVVPNLVSAPFSATHHAYHGTPASSFHSPEASFAEGDLASMFCAVCSAVSQCTMSVLQHEAELSKLLLYFYH